MRFGTLIGPEVKEILREDPEQIRALLSDIHPEDLADLVAELDPDEAAKTLERMSADEAAPIFQRLDESEQEQIASIMPPESVAQIASEMASDERADLFNSLPEKMGDELLATLARVDPQAAADVRAIEKWPETSAGHLMTTSYVPVTPRMTVAQALDAVRAYAKENREPVYNVYALEQGRKILGLMSLRELIIADPEDVLADKMRTNFMSVPPEEDQEEVARKMAKYDLNAMPVVGKGGELLGIATIDDIVDVLTQEQTEDLQKLGAVEPLDVPYFRTSFFEFIKKRAGWLVILFVEEFFTQTALRYYDPIMEAVKGALLYVPLLISSGGNSGSQSSTLVIRGLALGEIKLGDWWRILFREALMGVVLGCLIAVIAMGRVMMYPDQSFHFAITVGVTVLFIILAGCTVGSMLPIVLKRFGIDPATSSTPFIASLVDTLGVIIYAHVASVVMHDVISAAQAHGPVPSPWLRGATAPLDPMQHVTPPSIDNIRAFLAAARLLHFRRAAKSVALTPAAFGQRIKQLEDQLGAPLFSRTTRKVQLTEAGLLFLPYAERCLSSLDEGARAVRGETGPPAQELVLGTRHELGMSWIVPQLGPLAEERPYLKIHLYFGAASDLHAKVRTLEIDCAVTSARIDDDPKLDGARLHREDYVLVGSKGLMKRRPLKTLEQAEDHTLLDIGPDLPLFRYVGEVREGEAPLRFGQRGYLGTIAAIRKRVLDGAGVAVLPEYLVRTDLARGDLVTLLPRLALRSDYFRLVFRADDPRRALFEGLAASLAKVPLR